MRIWSLHPGYLDTKGLVALWREALLAKHVLEGKTKGYRNHPQLQRFKDSLNPEDSINQYLSCVYQEALKRGFNFDREKFRRVSSPVKISVTDGQVEFEASHLLKKLKIRDMKKYKELEGKKLSVAHPVFTVIKGGKESWEKNH
jgi:hypothetical protein